HLRGRNRSRMEHPVPHISDLFEPASVRVRLSVIIGATALLSMLAGVFVAILLPHDVQVALAGTLGRSSITSLLGLGAASAAAIALIGLLTRQSFRPAATHDRPNAAGGHESANDDTTRPGALIDALTGLGNHRAFQDELDRQLDVGRRYNTPVSV